MDNWVTWTAVVLAAFVLGQVTGHWHEERIMEPEMQELEVYRVVDVAMERAGAHRWCELVLAGEIVPVEPR